jgi:hypothetical protein
MYIIDVIFESYRDMRESTHGRKEEEEEEEYNNLVMHLVVN